MKKIKSNEIRRKRNGKIKIQKNDKKIRGKNLICYKLNRTVKYKKKKDWNFIQMKKLNKSINKFENHVETFQFEWNFKILGWNLGNHYKYLSF